MPLTLKSQVTRVLVLLDGGEWRRAASIACRILASYPLYIVAYNLNARAYLGLGELDTAQQLFERILSANPEDADAHMGLGMIHQTHGSDKAAREYLFRAYELAPGDLQVRQAMSDICRVPFGTLWEVFPMSRVGLARAMLLGRMFEQAIDVLECLVQQQPQRPDLWVALCEAYWQNQRYVQAAITAQQVLNIAPFCLKANLILGQLWLGSKRENDARLYFERSQALDPENRWAQIVLGRYSSLPLRVAYLNWDDHMLPEPEQAYLRNIDGEELLPE
ncbi:MAG: tetratricopeptide repeat protein [Anaerolineae bacterium]